MHKEKVHASSHSMLEWQYKMLISELQHLEMHASGDCPCILNDLNPPERCVGKHSLNVFSLAQETAKMDPVNSKMLLDMADEADEKHNGFKDFICHKEDLPELSDWARAQRKKLEPIYYSCKIPANLKQDAVVLEQDPKVKIYGQCTGSSCSIKVKGVVETEKNSTAAGLPDTIAEVIRNMEKKTGSKGSPLTYAIGPTSLTRYELKYKIIDSHKLVTSHNPFTFEVNKDYPQELQPRLRGRAANKAQVITIAANLEPSALIDDFHAIDRGAPIVNSDNVVLSGNGRIMAIQNAVKEHEKSFQNYASYLKAAADQYGLKIDSKIDHPVLVRELVSKVDMKTFTEEANASTTIAPSAVEVARSDAQKITPAMLNGLEIPEGLSIEDALRSRSNASFVSSFLDKLSANERGSISDSSGNLSQDGIRRITMAIFLNVFPGEVGLKISEKFFEATDVNVKAVFNGIVGALGKLAQSEALIKSGARSPGLSISEDLAQVVAVYSEIKKVPGMTVEKYLNQSQLFDRQLDKFQEKLLPYIDSRSRSGKKVARLLKAYADIVIDSPPPNQVSFMPGETLTKDQALETAAIRADEVEPVSMLQPVRYILEVPKSERPALLNKVKNTFSDNQYDFLINDNGSLTVYHAVTGREIGSIDSEGLPNIEKLKAFSDKINLKVLKLKADELLLNLRFYPVKNAEVIKALENFSQVNPENPNKLILNQDTTVKDLFEAAIVTAPGVSKNDIPYNFALQAYSGTSWYPEDRAYRQQLDYVNHMNAVYADLSKKADTSEKQEILKGEFERYRKGYLEHQMSFLGAHSRVMSSFITGPSNFPSRTMAKRNDTLDRRLNEWMEFDKKAQTAISKKINPIMYSISSDRADAVELLKKELAEKQKSHEMMLSANKIIRKKHSTVEDKIKELQTVGISEIHANELLKSNYWGVGFPPFRLTNNNANIKRIEDRIKEIERRQSQSSSEYEFDGGIVIDSVEDNRVQIKYDGKPSSEIISKLKSRGFHWTPSLGVWQRMRGVNAEWAVKDITGVVISHKKPVVVETTDDANVKTVAMPSQPEEIQEKPEPLLLGPGIIQNIAAFPLDSFEERQTRIIKPFKPYAVTQARLFDYDLIKKKLYKCNLDDEALTMAFNWRPLRNLLATSVAWKGVRVQLCQSGLIKGAYQITIDGLNESNDEKILKLVKQTPQFKQVHTTVSKQRVFEAVIPESRPDDMLSWATQEVINKIKRQPAEQATMFKGACPICLLQDKPKVEMHFDPLLTAIGCQIGVGCLASSKEVSTLPVCSGTQKKDRVSCIKQIKATLPEGCSSKNWNKAEGEKPEGCVNPNKVCSLNIGCRLSRKVEAK